MHDRMESSCRWVPLLEWVVVAARCPRASSKQATRPPPKQATRLSSCSMLRGQAGESLDSGRRYERVRLGGPLSSAHQSAQFDAACCPIL